MLSRARKALLPACEGLGGLTPDTFGANICGESGQQTRALPGDSGRERALSLLLWRHNCAPNRIDADLIAVGVAVLCAFTLCVSGSL